MGKLSISVLSVLLFVSVLWKPTHGFDKCSLACKGSPTAQSFLNGHKYTYGVEGTVSIFLTGASNQETSVKLLGQVSVTSIGNCVHELTVQNLVIGGPDGKKYHCPDGIDKPVRFTIQDGRIGPEICAEEEDTRRSLNIKRAIISLLQTEVRPGTQVDVFGTCPTEITSSQEGGSVLIHRSRDLSRCGYREQGRNELITGVFNANAEIKDTQILGSRLNVETKVNNGVPEKVSATEEYLYRPFSVGENGARAKVHTKLTLTGKTKAANPPSHCTESRTIIFEKPHTASKSQNNYQSALHAVKETAKTVASEASSKSAGNFAQLIRILRTNSKDDLLKVYNHVKSNNVEKRVFLDGLLRTGTGYSIEASLQLLKQKELNQFEQRIVFLSLGNARHVNDEAIKSAASILDTPNLPKEVYLGVGALAGTFCRDHHCHKVKNEGVTALSQKFAAKLQNCRAKTKVEEDYIVAVLKGIRNIRHLEDNLVEKLAHCALDNNVKPRVKAAVFEAFQADACSSKLKKTAIDVMKNRQLDSEIRIKAYLAIITCPCAGSASEIKKLLESEPVHQVGNFISTSLRNIRSSSNPDKKLARQHYGLIRIPNKFNNDIRKYSFSEEESFNVDALGVGGNVEQNVIYSQESFLPRSVSVNLTAEVFGQNLNILEVGARQGNLDRVVEHFLGPKGFFRTEDLQEVYKKYIAGPFVEYKEKASRGRRSIKSDVDNFDKNLKAESTPYNNELDLDVYVKLFGTDAVFLSLGDGKGFDFEKVSKEFLNYVNKGIDEVKHFQQEVRAHLLFLDAELLYPTSTGLPLKLDLIGAATGRFEAVTNIDIRQILKSPQDAKVDVKLVPSTDIEVTGALLVDADAVSAGLRVIVNLHSSTGAHVVAKVLEGGRGFDLQFGLPIDKQEVITASNDLVYFQAEKGQPEKYTQVKTDNKIKENHFCFDQAADYIGLTVCADYAVPFSLSGPEAQASISKFIANYPLTGSAKVRLSLEKQSLRGYHVKGVLRSDQSGKQSFELLFDAEGAKQGRAQLTGEYVYNDHAIGAQLSLDSAFKTIFGQVSATRSPSELVLLVKGKYDANDIYGKVGFRVQGGGSRTVYTPIAEYQLPGEKENHNIPMTGKVIEEVNGSRRKYTIENIKVNIPNVKDPICIDGHFTSAGSRDTEFDVSIKELATLKGSVKNNDVTAEFSNKLNPYVNFRLKGHFECDQIIRNEIDIVYGDNLQSSENRIVLGQMYKYHKGDNDFNLITKNKFEIYAVPLKAHFDADIDYKKIDVSVEGQYQDRKLSFDLDGRTQIKAPGDYSLKMKAEWDKNGFEAFSKRDIVSPDKSNFENYVELKNIGKYELSGVVLHKNKPNDVNVGAVGHLKITTGSKSQDIKFDIGQIETTNLLSSHAKITEAKGDLVEFLLKITRGANANGQLKLIVKNTIAANGQFKITDSNGVGNGVIIVDFKQSQRKIKGDFKFLSKSPNYNANVDVYFNFEKDNNDKLQFSTSTKQTDKLFDSKNKLEYNNNKYEFNLNQEGGLDKSGKTNAQVELVLAEGRCLTFKVVRDMKENHGTYSGNAEVVFSDAEKRGAAGTSLTYKAKVIDTNWDKKLFNYEGQLELKLKDGKKLLETFYLKNSPDGDKIKLEGKIDITGNLIPKPVSISGYIIESDSVTYRDDKYRLKVSYGDDISFELDEVFIVKLLEKGEKKYLDDATITIRLPFEKAHDLKIVSNVLYVQPEDKDEAEYTIMEQLQINADVYKIDANAKISPDTGYGTVKLLVPHNDPVSLDMKYENKRNNDKVDSRVELKAKYGKGKTASIVTEASAAPRDNKLSLKANAPHAEKFKKLEFVVHSKNPTPDNYISDVLIEVDDRSYKSESNIVFSKSNPVIDLKYTSPEYPKTCRLFVKGHSLSSTQRKLEIKIENIRDLSMDIVSEANVQRDNVDFKAVAKSEKLDWDYNVQIVSKDAGNGKRLEFQATNNNKNILSGSTTFVSKQEGPKTIIEGSGAVKVQEEQKSANFKYIRTILGEGNERGVETFFDMAIGDRSYVAETRVTNLEYKNTYLYCEQKKQCAHAEFVSKIDLSKSGTITNTVNGIFDLRTLGIAPEFGLNIKDEVSDSKLPQYTMDVHVNKDDKKYHLHIYNTPEIGNAKSGININLPHRILALESVVTYPTNKDLPFPVRGEVSFDLDKNKQGHKTSARFLIDVNVAGDKQQVAVAEFGFNHPKLSKEAKVKFQGKLNRPAENSFKIETSTTVSHPVLGSDREAKVLFEGSPTHVKFLVISPLVKVIDVEGSAVVNDNLQKGEFKFCLLEGKPVTVYAIAKDYQYFEFTTEEADRKLSIVGHIQPEKRVDISADLVLGGEKKNIINGALFIEDDLVKSKYGASTKNFEYFLNALKKDLENLETRIKGLFDKGNKEFKAILKRVEPTLKNLEKTYSEDLDKVYREIVDDKTLQEISQSLHDITTYVAKLIDEAVQVTKPLVDQITKLYIETANKISDMYEKQIEPQLKELGATLTAVLKELLDGILSVVAHFASLVQDFYEKHKPEFEELTNAFTNIFKDVTRLLVAQLREIRGRLQQICNEFSEQYKDMPIIATLKERYKELAVPEQMLAVIQDIYGTLSGLLPTPELRDFFDAVYKYNVKKIKQEKCDDQKELREIYKKLSPAVNSVIQLVRNQVGQYGVSTSYSGFGAFSFGSGGFTSTPTLGGSASASLLSKLLQGDIPDVIALIKTYRPRSLNPLDEVPAKLRAVIVDGQHIFTFDGRHLTFPGNCRYILAHDHVDRNFTLAIQLVNGAPKALILEDKSGAVIELKDNGAVALNGANHGFPTITKDAFAFRQANGRIGLGSLYGIMAFCTSKLQNCYIEVNGFYHGKLRGLLGNGNNEPYDDFRLPSGKICESESEFGNSYRLTRCPQVQTPEHNHHQLHHTALPPACEKVFGSTSPLRAASLFLDVAPFRQACIHACSGDSEEDLEKACNLGRAYTALAVTGLLPAIMPEVCLQCTDADKPRKYGETYELKVPGKQADIIVVFETTKVNEKNYKNIVIPLMTQVIDGLKSKKITDIKVYLVGLTSKYPYPIIYDTDLKLKNAKVEFDDDSRYNLLQRQFTPTQDPILRFAAMLAGAYDSLVLELGVSNVDVGYYSVFDLPLRAAAVKHTINVVGEECMKPSFLVEAFWTVASSAVFENIAYSHSVFAVTPYLKIGGGKDYHNIVGYTEDAVIMLGDKKVGKDAENLRPTLEKTIDTCKDYYEHTKGLVFSSTNFHTLNAGQQKQYLQTAAAAILQRLLHESMTQECTCSYTSPFQVQSYCTSKDKKEVARRRK